MRHPTNRDRAAIGWALVNGSGFNRVWGKFGILRIGEQQGVCVICVAAIVIENASHPTAATAGKVVGDEQIVMILGDKVQPIVSCRE